MMDVVLSFATRPRMVLAKYNGSDERSELLEDRMASLREDGRMRMSEQELKQAIRELLEDRAPSSEIQCQIHARIVLTAAQILRNRQGVSQDAPFDPPLADVLDLVAKADARQLKILKAAAEEIQVDE